MSRQNNKYDSAIWFPAKRYGWGWGFPVKWQGWLVLAIYVVLVLELVSRRSQPPRSIFLLYLFTLTAAFIAVCWIKGEKPRWRSGKVATNG